jgi:DNA-binding CsgD family transcriptional regulator/ligand-binding sensor domain-containing protein
MLGLPIRGPGSDTVNALELDQQGRIWIGTRAGVCLWEGGQFVDASALAALEGAPGASFLSDRDGSVWIATATRGLFEFTEGRLHEEFGPNESRRILSCCLLHDHRGRLWALIGKGIVLCRRNGQWAEFNLSNGLPLAYISSLAEGPDGSIWAGWLDDGLFQLRGGRFIPFRHEDGLSGGAIREITSGGAPMSRQIARRVVQFFQEINEAPKEVQRAPEIRTLTTRESQVLAALAKGHSYKEIADLLNISLETVRTHLRSVYEKLHIHSRTEAVLKYLGR